MDEIQKRCIEPGMNFVTIRTRKVDVPEEYFYAWAKYLAEHQIYFIFLYTMQNAPEGTYSHLNAKIVKGIQKIAGKYFLGDMIGETGSSFACKQAGYYSHVKHTSMPPQNLPDMEVAARTYISRVKEMVEYDHSIGIEDVITVEATALNNYNMEAGVTMPMLELMCGNPEILVPALRGTARMYHAKLWGTYIAHEWYGGMRHGDILKQKRLELAYKYAYLAGSQAFCLESGDESLESYGQKHEMDHPYCQQYRQVLQSFNEWIQKDERPAGGPKAKVAFVQGNLDAFGGWGGSSLWSQFEGESWGHSVPEYSWHIFNEIGKTRHWSDPALFGEEDVSAFPAYGQFDIVPAKAKAKDLARYDYIIFAGWNTMTNEIYQELLTYVQDGGHLFMATPHLNTNPRRGGEAMLIHDGHMEDLFGCVLQPGGKRMNVGYHFKRESMMEGVQYPYSSSPMADPIYSAGYVTYTHVTPKGCEVIARASNTFFEDKPDMPIALIEHRCGKGIASLLTVDAYPGDGAVYPLYRTIVRELLQASHRNCDIKVVGSDSVRFAVYPNNQLYLLNTSYDVPSTVTIKYEGKEEIISLDPLALKAWNL